MTRSVIPTHNSPNWAIPLYATSKHALVGFVRSVAPMFAVDDIRVNAILPVMIATNLMPEQLRAEWDEAQLTPMATALKAYDTFLDDESMIGQTVELTLEELVFKQRPEYSNANVSWMFSQTELWEKVSEPLLPRPPGRNVARKKIDHVIYTK